MPFSEDRRWPSKSQRFGWVVVAGIAIFIAFQLNLHRSMPAVAAAVLLVLIALLLVVLTVKRRLVIRIGNAGDVTPVRETVRRFWQRATRALPVESDPVDDELVLTVHIVYTSRGPRSALSPGRRGSRLGRWEREIPLSAIETWSTDQLSFISLLRPRGNVFPVGAHRDAVTLVLEDGERLTLPTRRQAEFLAALSAAKVATLKLQQAAQVQREEL